MLAGELYQAWGEELTAERIWAKELCFRLNQTPPSDNQTRSLLVKELLGVSDAVIESPFQCDYGYNIKVGRNFYVNHGCVILDCNLVTIGDNVMFAPNVTISAAFHPLSSKVRVANFEQAYPITIRDNVWVGACATILPGVTIGKNVVIGAGAVVTKDIPDNVVCAGVPARIIKYLDDEGEPVNTEG